MPTVKKSGSVFLGGPKPATAADVLVMAAVLAAPEDDTLRLAFADWFEEHGEPDRAEYIRLQIEQARLYPDLRCGAGPGCTCRACSLVDRMSELWLSRSGEWAEADCPGFS